MGKRLAVFLTVFFYFKGFLVKNAKIDFLKKKMVMRVVFIKLKFRWLQIGLSDWKNAKQLDFAYGGFFTHFLKCCIIQKILRFLKFTSISW